MDGQQEVKKDVPDVVKSMLSPPLPPPCVLQGFAQEEPANQGTPDLGYAPTPKPEGEWSVNKVVKAISEGPELKKKTYVAENGEKTGSPLPFFHLLERLKTTQREGWRRFGVSR